MIDIHLFVVPPTFTAIFGCAVIWIAFCLGGWRERAVSSAQLLTGLASRSVCSVADCWSDTHGLGALTSVTADALLLAVCLVFLRGAERYWIVWASASALLAVTTDLTALLVPDVTPWAYLSADVIWFYLSSAAVLWGVLGSRRPAMQKALG